MLKEMKPNSENISFKRIQNNNIGRNTKETTVTSIDQSGKTSKAKILSSLNSTAIPHQLLNRTTDSHNRSYQSSVKNRHLRTHSAAGSAMSRNPNRSALNTDLTVVQTEYEHNMKTLENLILGIKKEGFEKLRNEIETKSYVKAEIESRIEKLTANLNFINSQKKKYGTKNLVYEQGTYLSHVTKEVNYYINLIF